MSAVPLWAKYSTTWYQDPKVLGVSIEAEMLYAHAIAWCKEQLTDGLVDRNALIVLGQKLTDPVAAADELVKARLWRRKGRNYAFPLDTWRRWQGTRGDVSQQRAYEATRKRAYRAAKAAGRNGDGPGAVPAGQTGDTGQRDAEPEPEPEPEIDTPLNPPAKSKRAAGRRGQGGQAPPHPPVDVIRNLDRMEGTVTQLSDRFHIGDWP